MQRFNSFNFRNLIGLITWLAVPCACLAQQPATEPTTQPATAPAAPETVTLDRGKIAFTPPAELIFQGKRNDDRSAGYVVGANDGLITIVAVPQNTAITDEMAPQLARLIGQTIREEAQRENIDLILPPRAEPDERFMLRIHDKFNTEERFGDRVQLYRPVGLYLVSVTATAFTEDEAEVLRIHELGADMLLSARLNLSGAAERSRPARVERLSARPVTFENAKVRLMPPEGWEAEQNDNASGIIVTYHDPHSPTNFISISVRPLPQEALRDPKLRDVAIDEIVAGEQQSVKIDGAQIVGETRVLRDRRFLRKTQTEYDHEGRQLRLTSRQIRAGDVVVSVTMVALREDADVIDRLADQVAAGVRAAR